MVNLNELRQQRGQLITQARAVLQKARDEKRDPTKEENERWDQMLKDADDLRAKIDQEERQRAADKTLEERSTEPVKPTPGGGEPEVRMFDGRMVPKSVADKAEERMNRYLRGDTLTSAEVDEQRALEAGLDTSGGFLVTTQEMSGRLIKAVDDLTFVRQHAQVDQVTSAESLGIPTLTDPADFDWTAELLTGSEDSTMAFGKRELRPHPLAKRIKVSRKLMRSSTRDPVSLVGQRFAYKQAITQEKAFLSGTGVMRPLGVFIASSDGISTGRDVSTDNTTTAMTADNLVRCKYTLKGAYWPVARWLFHRDGASQIARLKDGEGRYLFNIDRNTLLGFPVDVSEYAPNTFTSALYVGLLAAWAQGYQIVDALTMEIQRLEELYAATNQVGFIMRSETDGAPVLEEAFVRVKLG